MSLRLLTKPRRFSRGFLYHWVCQKNPERECHIKVVTRHAGRTVRNASMRIPRPMPANRLMRTATAERSFAVTQASLCPHAWARQSQRMVFAGSGLPKHEENRSVTNPGPSCRQYRFAVSPLEGSLKQQTPPKMMGFVSGLSPAVCGALVLY